MIFSISISGIFEHHRLYNTSKSLKFPLFGFLLLSFSTLAQDRTVILTDSDAKSIQGDFQEIEVFQSKSTLNPDKAVLYATVLPGLGQMYNGQYWKLPILYGGAIIIAHYINYNNVFYNEFRNAYLAETDNDDSTVNPFGRYSAQALQRNAERFKRDRDYLMIIGAVYYLIQVMDAHVSAHLIEFDINDDLVVRPSYHLQQQYFVQNIGLSLVLKLSK